MRVVCSMMVAALLPASAMAEKVKPDFTAPTEVKMFESIRLVNGKGKIKGGSCADAAAAAMADMQAMAAKKKHPVIVALYDERPKFDLSATVDEVTCEAKGKNMLVKMEGMAIREGGSSAFPTISPERTIAIADALVVEGAMVQVQLQWTNIEDRQGQLYYKAGSSRDEVFDRTWTKNSRGVELFRSDISRQARAIGASLTSVPEVSGVHLYASCKYINKKGEEKSESWNFYVTTEATTQFSEGNMSEQEFVNSGTLLHAYAGKPEVKTDIDFVLADAR